MKRQRIAHVVKAETANLSDDSARLEEKFHNMVRTCAIRERRSLQVLIRGFTIFLAKIGGYSLISLMAFDYFISKSEEASGGQIAFATTVLVLAVVAALCVHFFFVVPMRLATVKRFQRFFDDNPGLAEALVETSSPVLAWYRDLPWRYQRIDALS